MSCDDHVLNAIIGSTWQDKFGGSFQVLRHIIDPNDPIYGTAIGYVILIKTPWGLSDEVSVYDRPAFKKTYRNGDEAYDVEIVLFLGTETNHLDIETCLDTMPARPTGLGMVCELSGTQAQVYWTKVRGVDYYKLRVNLEESPGHTCGAPPGDFCVDVDSDFYRFPIHPGKQYNFWVHAVEGSIESPASEGFIFNCSGPVQQGTLNCTSNPVGASITIGTTNYGSTNRNITLNPGTYTVKYSLTGYEDYTRTVTISENTTTYMSTTLIKKITTGTLRLSINPHNATRWIKDLSQIVPFYLNYGNSVTSIELNAGMYDLKLTHDGYEDSVQTIQIWENQTTTITVSLKRLQGRLDCRSVPTGADIFVGTTDYGNTNKIIGLNPGWFTIRFSLAGYGDVSDYIQIRAGETTVMSKTLVPTTGSIRCQAYDSVSNTALQAVVYIDNVKNSLLTPFTVSGIQSGTHTIRFECEGMGSCEGYESDTDTVTVVAGQQADAYGSMVKLPEPDVPGFDINVNIPGFVPGQDLRISEVIQIPLTDDWYNYPLASGMSWNNISNGLYKARENRDGCAPAPASFNGLKPGANYAIYAGDPVVAVHPSDRVFELTDIITNIDITEFASVPEYLGKLCDLLNVPEMDCATSFYSAVPDIIFSAEDLSIIIDGKSIYPPYDEKTPTPWNYLWVLLTFTPIGIIQKVSKPATAIIKSAKLDPKLADILTEMNFGKRVTFMTEDQLNLISTFAEELRYDDIRTLLSGIPEKPANLEDYKKWMASLKDVIGDEKAVKNMDIGVKRAPTTIKHADALFDMAADYSDDADKLLDYFRSSKLDDVVDLANDIEANPTTYNKLIDGSEVIDPYKYGMSLKNLYYIDALLTPGNVDKLQNAGKLDGFAHGLFMSMQDTPEIYRELMKHVPDSDISRLSDELTATGHLGLASIYDGLKSVNTAESTGGLYSGLDSVGKTLTNAADEGGAAGDAARSILDDAVDVIPTNAADDAAAAAFEATDDAVKMPGMQQFWQWVKDTAAEAGQTWSSMTLAEKARWYAKYIFTVGCFGLFIAEETIQWVGFGSIPLWNLVNRWDSKTVEQRQSVISDLKWFLDARRKMHDTIGLTLIPLTIACPFMAPLYYKFHQADAVNIEAYSRTIEYLEKDINPQTGLGICRIPVKSNLSGVDVYMDGMPTGKKAYPYVQYIENVPVKETEYEIAIVGTKSGYLPDTQMITIYPTDIGKTTGDVFLELQPESIIDEVNPFPYQEPSDNSTLPEPYGPIDSSTWWSGDVGDVWCNSDPSFAEVWVESNKYPGVTPLKIESLEAGDYTLVYKKEDYEDCQDNITILAGRQIESFCELEFKCSDPKPSISVTPSEPTTGESVRFTGSVADADQTTMKNWEWDIAGERKTGPNVTHTFTTEGTKSVKLTVTNECDSTFTTSRTVYVSRPDVIGYVNCYCSGDYCGEGATILLDGENTGQKTTNKPFYTVVQATAGRHTIEYNYKDIMKCDGPVTVVAGEDASIDCTPVGVLDPTQTGVDTIVTEIIDGDTIRTKYTDDIADSPSVRLVGYDAAESGTVQGIEATELLTSYIPVGTPITLKIWAYSPIGVYGRVLGGVFKDGVDINLEMLKSCIVELSSYRDKFYWVDWAVYENQYCDNDLYGNLTVKTYSAPNAPMTGVTVYVDGLDRGNAPVTVKSLSIGPHSVRLESADYLRCKYCENSGCTPGSPISPCDFSVNIDAGTTKILEVTMLTQIIEDEDATWEIRNATDVGGNVLSAARVFVDNIYIGHYAPELLTFCTGCTCDTVVPCGFGTHTVTVKKTGYKDWSNTRTLNSGDSFADTPVLEQTFEVEILSVPEGATIKVDGVEITTSLNLIQQILLGK